MTEDQERPGDGADEPDDDEVERVERGEEDDRGSMSEEVERAAEREDEAAEG